MNKKKNRQENAADEASDSQRLDKWLWAARFFKTRNLASEAIAGGKVHLEGQRVKPSRPIKPGFRLQISRGEFRYDVEVKALNEQRRPAKEAVLLYEESEESRRRREETAQQLRDIRSSERLARGEGRPNKKQRREIVKFRKF